MSKKQTTPKSLLEFSDEELMSSYVAGDYAAFEELYKRHAGRVNGFLTKKLKKREMIEDVFQMTFFRLHQSRRRYDPSLPFLPWLFTLCRNAMVDSLRTQKRVLEQSSEDIFLVSEQLSEIPAEPLLNAGSPELIDEWGNGLSQKERDVLSLRFTNDFSFDEIAKRLAINSVNARKISQRALQKLRSLWK